MSAGGGLAKARPRVWSELLIDAYIAYGATVTNARRLRAARRDLAALEYSQSYRLGYAWRPKPTAPT